MPSPEMSGDRNFGEKIGFTVEAVGAVGLAGTVIVGYPPLVVPFIGLVAGGEVLRRVSKNENGSR